VGARARAQSRGEWQLGRDGGRHCFENNWLGGAGQEREKGEGVGVRVGVGVGEEGRGGPCATVGGTGWPTVAPRRRARAAALFRE
jgi:hypothetical protein